MTKKLSIAAWRKEIVTALKTTSSLLNFILRAKPKTERDPTEAKNRLR